MLPAPIGNEFHRALADLRLAEARQAGGGRRRPRRLRRAVGGRLVSVGRWLIGGTAEGRGSRVGVEGR